MLNWRTFLKQGSKASLGGLLLTSNLPSFISPLAMPAPGLQLFTFFNTIDSDVNGTLQDPVALFKKNPNRFPLWHIKDLDASREKVLPLGEGTIDFKPVFQAAATAGMKYYFIEHDMPADALKSITTSFANLKTLTA